MPLRLTSQLVNLLKPHGQKGLLEGAMIHALRALRRDSDLLLSTMDVFVKEPSLDWQVCPLLPSMPYFLYIRAMKVHVHSEEKKSEPRNHCLAFSEAAIKIRYQETQLFIYQQAIFYVAAKRVEAGEKHAHGGPRRFGFVSAHFAAIHAPVRALS